MLVLLTFAAVDAASTQSRVVAALANESMLERPGEDGLATMWDGNEYVECRYTTTYYDARRLAY